RDPGAFGLPAEERDIIGSVAEAGTPVDVSDVLDLEAGLLSRFLDQLELLLTTGVRVVIHDTDSRAVDACLLEQLLRPVDVDVLQRFHSVALDDGVIHWRARHLVERVPGLSIGVQWFDDLVDDILTGDGFEEGLTD